MYFLCLLTDYVLNITGFKNMFCSSGFFAFNIVSVFCLQDAPVDKCVLASMRWGLVPSWFKESDPSKMQYSTSNCRSENILQKKSYKVLYLVASDVTFPVHHVLLYLSVFVT